MMTYCQQRKRVGQRYVWEERSAAAAAGVEAAGKADGEAAEWQRGRSE